MAQTKVRQPDGSVITVNHPDGAPPQQILAFAKRQYTQPKATPSLASRALNAIGVNSAGARGFGDSRAFGLADEIGAVFDTLGVGGSGEERPNIWKGDSPLEAWRENQRRNSQQLAQTQQQAPRQFLTGQVVGAVLPGPSSKAAAASSVGQRVKAFGQSLPTVMKSRAGQAVGRAAVAALPDLARGAAYGAGSAEGGLAERAAGAARGASTGLAGHAAGKAAGATVARALRGGKVSPAVRTLADEGVVMTPWRRGGPIRRTYEETVLGSIPFVKSVPQAANRRSVEQLNVAFYNRVLKPIGQKLPMTTPAGRETVEKVGSIAYDAYDNAASGLNLGADTNYSAVADALKKGAKASVGSKASHVADAVNRTNAALKGGLSGTAVRDLIQDLRGEASGWAQSSSYGERKVGKELWKLHAAVEDALERQNGGQALKAFKDARESVSLFRRVEAAAAKSKDGVASPQQFRTAVTKRGYGTTTSKVARGKAPMQDLSDAASLVLPGTVANSGTPERAIGAALAASGPASIMHFLDPTMGVGAGASLAGYVPGIDRVLQNFALNRPDLLIRAGNAVERTTPALGTAGTVAALTQDR
jgi:hypothetical protein